MYEFIVFDLDGTLLDTLDDLTSAVNAALEKYHLPLRTREEVRGFVGNGIAKLMERAIGQQDFVHFQEVLSAFKEYYAAHCADLTKPYEGILSLLEECKKREIPVGVLSNKADFAVQALCKMYFGDLISCCMGENEEAGIAKKPAPDALFALLDKMQIAKEKTVYVGDSEVDIQTANNAEVDCISVTWGFKDRAFLEKEGGEIFVDQPMQILSYFEKEGI